MPTIIIDRFDGKNSFEQSYKLDPADVALELGLAEALGAAKDDEGAIASCERAVAKNPDVSSAHGCLGSMRMDLRQDADGAIAEFTRAVELDPDLIEFTRPPLLPGADVSSIPPPDNCAGYLGAATSMRIPAWVSTYCSSCER